MYILSLQVKTSIRNQHVYITITLFIRMNLKDWTHTCIHQRWTGLWHNFITRQ